MSVNFKIKNNLIQPNINPKTVINNPTYFLSINSERFQNLGKFLKLFDTFHATLFVYSLV